ncbi:unnamed protein product [Scytosiphon promiscuus]
MSSLSLSHTPPHRKSPSTAYGSPPRCSCSVCGYRCMGRQLLLGFYVSDGCQHVCRRRAHDAASGFRVLGFAGPWARAGLCGRVPDVAPFGRNRCMSVCECVCKRCVGCRGEFHVARSRIFRRRTPSPRKASWSGVERTKKKKEGGSGNRHPFLWLPFDLECRIYITYGV